jgi:hypothetical protein
MEEVLGGSGDGRRRPLAVSSSVPARQPASRPAFQKAQRKQASKQSVGGRATTRTARGAGVCLAFGQSVGVGSYCCDLLSRLASTTKTQPRLCHPLSTPTHRRTARFLIIIPLPSASMTRPLHSSPPPAVCGHHRARCSDHNRRLDVVSFVYSPPPPSPRLLPSLCAAARRPPA